ITKHLSCQFLKTLLNQRLECIGGWGWRAVGRGVLPFAPRKCYRGWGEGNSLRSNTPGTPVTGSAGGLLARNAQALTAFPEALAADAQLVGQLGFGHMLLVFQHKMLEVVFQGKVFRRLGT